MVTKLQTNPEASPRSATIPLSIAEQPNEESSISLELDRRNQRIIKAKLEDNEPVKDIARRFNLCVGTVYSILRQAGTGKNKEAAICYDCEDEYSYAKEHGIFPRPLVEKAIAKGKCLKHYQRDYRRHNKPKLAERDNEIVPLLDANGRVIGETTVRERRLASHRDAQRRYCDRHPERIRSILQRYRVSDRGKEANRRAVQKYRDRKRQERISEMVKQYRPTKAPEVEVLQVNPQDEPVLEAAES